MTAAPRGADEMNERGEMQLAWFLEAVQVGIIQRVKDVKGIMCRVCAVSETPDRPGGTLVLLDDSASACEALRAVLQLHLKP
jgi:hypothetical protein